MILEIHDLLGVVFEDFIKVLLLFSKTLFYFLVKLFKEFELVGFLSLFRRVNDIATWLFCLDQVLLEVKLSRVIWSPVLL